VLDTLAFGEDSIRDLCDNKSFEIVKGDMRNIPTVVATVKGVDAVIHLAAIVGDPACAVDAEETIENNYFATKMIAEVCKYNQVNRFIFASTCSVYGASSDILTEDSELRPLSLYAQTKLKSEESILGLLDDNFSPTILRMGTLYGPSPRMRFDLVVNLLTAKATKEGKIRIFGGFQWRPFVHVEDAAEAYITCLEAPVEKIRGQIFNVGSNEQNYQIEQVGHIIKKIIPDIEIEICKEDTDERNYRVSFDKLSKTLNYRTKKALMDGILEIKELFVKNTTFDYTDSKYNNHKMSISVRNE